MKRNLTELEENLSKTKKYFDYDDIEYNGIKDVKDLFDLSIDEDYYKPVITKGAFNNNYIQYESKGDKGKDLKLTIAINFTSSKDSDETRTMHAKSNNVEIMIGSETDEVIEELFKSFLQNYHEGLEESMRGSVNLFLIVLMHCIIILIKYA